MGKKNSFSGSLTVEAAFVMPIIIYAIFALIYLAFYLHDYCRLQGIVDKTFLKAETIMRHETNPNTGEICYEQINDRGIFYSIMGGTEEKETIQGYIKQALSQGLFLSKVTDIQTKVEDSTITILVTAEIKVTLPGVKQLFRNFSHMSIEEEYKIHNPAEALRRYEVILTTGSEIKGADQLKEKLKNILNIK